MSLTSDKEFESPAMYDLFKNFDVFLQAEVILKQATTASFVVISTNHKILTPFSVAQSSHLKYLGLFLGAFAKQ
jgi:hypothetical protein